MSLFFLYFKVSGRGIIDREKDSILKLVATAADTPQGGLNQRKSSVNVSTSYGTSYRLHTT